MATKTITFDTGEWVYPDSYGITHTVTNAQTLTFTLTDGGAAAVTYAQDAGSVTTTDGLKIVVAQQADINNTMRTFGPTADTQDATAIRNLAGEMSFVCPRSGRIQHWKSASMTVDNVDAPTAISGTWEDQYDNVFTWTTITVS